MPNLMKTNAAETFRISASDNLKASADMTLHELVDEFQRLTAIMDDGAILDDDQYDPKLSEAGEVARRQRAIINGAARARFGIAFQAWDRVTAGYGDF